MPRTGFAGAAVCQRDQFAFDDMRCQAGRGRARQYACSASSGSPLAHRDRVRSDWSCHWAAPPPAEPDPRGKMAAIVEFGQRRLDRAITAVDGDDARTDQRDRAHGRADLIDMLHLIMENISHGWRNRHGYVAAGRGCPSICGFDKRATATIVASSDRLERATLHIVEDDVDPHRRRRHRKADPRQTGFALQAQGR